MMPNVDTRKPILDGATNMAYSDITYGSMISRMSDSEARRTIYASQAMTKIVDRRQNNRVYHFLPAVVRGINKMGEKFEARTTITNLSSSGLYLHLHQEIEVGTRVFIVFQLILNSSHQQAAPRVAVRGVVQRIQQLSCEGECQLTGMAVHIQHQRFF